LKVAIEAVRKASLVCVSVQSALVKSSEVKGAISKQKEDRSPVTVADFAAQALVVLELLKAFPDCLVVGEEDSKDLKGDGKAAVLRGQVVSHVRSVDGSVSEERVLSAIDHGRHVGGSSGRFWALDPIDGTKGFLRGEQYAVALGLVVDGKVVLGVLGCPNLPMKWSEREVKDHARGVIFAGVKGEGAWSMAMDHPETRVSIKVSDVIDPKAAFYVESVEAGHSDQEDAANIARHLGMGGESLGRSVRMDSQAKYGVLARGDAPIYLRLPTRKDYVEKIWDHAAGTAVVEAAGGRATDIHGKPLDFSLGRELKNNEGVIVTNGHLHDKVLEAVAAVLAAKAKAAQASPAVAPAAAPVAAPAAASS